MKYRVKFLDLVEQTKEEHDYTNLFDAIKVAKESNIGPHGLHIEAIPDVVFNEHFLTLLTSGFLYAGQRTHEFPDGDTLVMLLKVNEDTGVESPVYDGIPLAFVSTVVPNQITSQV